MKLFLSHTVYLLFLGERHNCPRLFEFSKRLYLHVSLNQRGGAVCPWLVRLPQHSLGRTSYSCAYMGVARSLLLTSLLSQDKALTEARVRLYIREHREREREERPGAVGRRRASRRFSNSGYTKRSSAPV